MLEQRVDNELRLWNEYYNNDGIYLNDILIAIFAYLGKENFDKTVDTVEKMKNVMSDEAKPKNIDELFKALNTQLDELYSLKPKSKGINEILYYMLSLIFLTMDEKKYDEIIKYQKEVIDKVEKKIDYDVLLPNIERPLVYRDKVKVECAVAIRTLTAVKNWIEEDKNPEVQEAIVEEKE